MWIDSHCHLDAPEFDADRDAVRKAAKQAGVDYIGVEIEPSYIDIIEKRLQFS